MSNEDLKVRTKNFDLRIIKLVESMPNTQTAQILGKQLLRCGTPVAANYRAACRGRSKADFISKMGIVEEEANEAVFWIEMLTDAGVVKNDLVKDLKDEGIQLTKIFVSSIITARGGKR